MIAFFSSILALNAEESVNSFKQSEKTSVNANLMPEIEGYCKKSRYGTRVSKKRVDGVIHYTCSTPNANVCFNYWVACEGTDAIANAVAVSDGSGTPVSVNYLGTSTDQIGNETLSFTIQ